MNQTTATQTNQEILEGYIVDLACIRSYSQDECAERASVHTKECALMGHCIESGYGLIDEEGRVHVLDPEATPHLVDVLHRSALDRGIKARVYREREGHEMQTRRVEETPLRHP